MSLKGLEADKFVRITTGMLPEAEVAYLDDIFKSSSAILNTLLSIMNERLFSNGAKPTTVPLVALFGSSNELPEGRELEALFDRFALRFEIAYLLRPQNLKDVLAAAEPKLATVLDMKTLRAAQLEVAKGEDHDATVEALISIRDACKAEDIIASDRRGKSRCAWCRRRPGWRARSKRRPRISLCWWMLRGGSPDRNRVAKIVGRLADPVATQALEILDAAKETADKVAGMKAGDRKLYISQAANALESFTQQMSKLQKLGKSAGRRAKDTIDAADADITAMHEELARAVSSGLGLRRRQK